jgi:hypothetical protein
MDFPNGYGVSVVRFTRYAYGSPFDSFIVGMCADSPGYGSYTSNESEWELAVFHKGSICYDTPITDDVLGHLSDDAVTKVMGKVQRLKAVKAKRAKAS